MISNFLSNPINPMNHRDERSRRCLPSSSSSSKLTDILNSPTITIGINPQDANPLSNGLRSCL